MRSRVDWTGPVLAVATVVLHENHDHGSESAVVDPATVLAAVGFVLIAGAGTWYLYHEYGT